MRVIPHARQVRRVPHTARLVVEERRAGEVPCACWPRWACYSCWAWLSGYGPMACSSPACCWPFRRRIGGMAASRAMVLGLVYGVSRHRRGGAFMVRVHAAHRLRYCTAAGPRLDRSPGWGTDCGKWPLPQCLADRGLSPFPCRCNAFGPVAFGRRALDMGVAADHALVRPWHRPSPDAGDDAGRPAWIRSGPGPRLLGRARRALLHAQDRARESSRATRSRIADIDEERAQSIRMATLGERTRIAREIHDNVGHLLTRAIMQAQAGKTVAKATNDTVAAQGFATLGATWMMR